MRKGRKQRLKGGIEYDVIYARDMYCYLHNLPKNVRDAKRAMNKRTRQEDKHLIEEELDMSSAIECDSCGAVLREGVKGWYCPNEECTSVTGDRGVQRMSSTVLDRALDERMEDPIDVVNNPNHYKLFPDTEVIEVIRNELTEAEFMGYCKGNSLKYRLRAGKKDSIEQDIAKAMKYEAWLLE